MPLASKILAILLIATTSLALVPAGDLTHVGFERERKKDEFEAKIEDRAQELEKKETLVRKQMQMGYTDYKLSKAGVTDVDIQLPADERIDKPTAKDHVAIPLWQQGLIVAIIFAGIFLAVKLIAGIKSKSIKT